MVKSDALTLERSILVNYTSNDTKAIGFFLIIILRRIKNQLRLYHLIKYSLRFINNKTGLLIRIFEKYSNIRG